MRACDQSSIFSTGGKFRPDYGLLLELHTLTLVAPSYVLLAVASISNSDYQDCARAICVLQPISMLTAGLRSCMYYCQCLSVVTICSAEKLSVHSAS